MRYVRNTFDYFRDNDERITSILELKKLAKEQTEREPIDKEQAKSDVLGCLISVVVVTIIISLVYAGYKAIEAMDNPDYIFENPIILYSFFGVFLLVGMIFTFGPVIKNVRLKIKCTEEVQGKCIGFNDKSNVTKHTSYVSSCPVYRFTMNNQEFTVYDGKHYKSNANFPHVGELASIKIDPANPNNCIINDKLPWYILNEVVGVAFIAASITVLVACILNL